MRPKASNQEEDPVQAIETFVRSGAGNFDQLALEVARFQAARSAALRRLWRRAGLQPDRVDSWEKIPALPTLAFKQLNVGVGEAEREFTSSGTSGDPSRHPHAHLDLYRVTIDAAFSDLLRPIQGPVDVLSLVPDLETAPRSSLAFMVDHLIARHGSDGSGYAWGERGLQLGKLRSWLAASQRRGKPVVIFATSLALVDALERLARIGLKFRLPPGSRVIHTGGRKTSSRELNRGQMLTRMAEHLGLAADALMGEYGMTELTSQFYGRGDASDPDRGEVFRSPAWARVRILDPETLEETPEGTPGLIAVLDLANLSSSIHVLTQDLGVAVGGGFRVLGRAQGAELRGCSLLTEQLSA